MDLPNYQSQIAMFVQTFELETGVEARILDLVSEIGELAKEVLKGSDYGASEYTQSSGWEEELADIFFSLICLANSTNINLEDALEKSILKYQQRLNETGEAGSGR